MVGTAAGRSGVGGEKDILKQRMGKKANVIQGTCNCRKK
jgi:hypothetical protein